MPTVDEGGSLGAALLAYARNLEAAGWAFSYLFDGIATRAGGPRFWRDNLVRHALSRLVAWKAKGLKSPPEPMLVAANGS